MSGSAYAARLKTEMKPMLDELVELRDLETPSDDEQARIDALVVELAAKKASFDLAVERHSKTLKAESAFEDMDDQISEPRARSEGRQRSQEGAGEVKALSSYLLDARDFKNPHNGLYNVGQQAPIAALYPYLPERKAAFLPTNLSAAHGDVRLIGPNTPRIPHPFLQLLRTIPYNDLSVPYLRPTFTNNAADVVFGQAKPESTNSGAIATVTMHTIAHWKEVPRQILRYLPGMRALIDDELIGGVLSKVEDIVLNANGSGSSMNGILNQITQTGSGTTMIDAILNALGVIGEQGGVADAILMNPSDYWALIALGYSNNQFSPIIQNGQFSGVPVVLEGSLAAGTTIVGDWNRAVALYVGEFANVRATEALGFKSNIVTILAEMDCVVLVERPNLLVKTTAPIVAP